MAGKEIHGVGEEKKRLELGERRREKRKRKVKEG